MKGVAFKNSSKNSLVKLKVCGMGLQENILDVAALQPDYLGFIFYEESPRNFISEIPEISSSIKKTGVFVDASLEFILAKVKKYGFKAIQLHGEESAIFCRDLREKMLQTMETSEVEIIKVFSIKDKFDFGRLAEFEGLVNYFLFDTKGKNKGGNGYTFNWKILKAYPSKTPFFLSGGIGLEETEDVQELISFFKRSGKEELLYAVDVNSKFEITPGNKDTARLKNFSNNLRKRNS